MNAVKNSNMSRDVYNSNGRLLDDKFEHNFPYSPRYNYSSIDMNLYMLYFGHQPLFCVYAPMPKGGDPYVDR